MVLNSHKFRYAPFQKWLERNIIDVDEDNIVHILALCYEIWCDRSMKYFEGADLDVAATFQKTQRYNLNIKSANTMLLETLSGCPILPIYVNWSLHFSGFYKISVDATCSIKRSKWGIGVVVRDNEGVAFVVSC